MSMYVVNQDPDKYGNQQEDFLYQSNLVIKSAVESFQKAVVGKKDLIKLFHETLDLFAKTRNEIAVKHGTKDAKDFGSPRNNSYFKGPCAMTPLSDPYHEYNDRLIPVIQKTLKLMKYTNREFLEKELKIKGEKYLDRNFSTECSLFSVENEKQWAMSFSFNEYKKLCQLSKVPLTDDSIENENFQKNKFIFQELIGNKEAMEILKQKSPEDYKRIKLNGAIREMSNRYPYKEQAWGEPIRLRKSDWVLITLRLEINGKMYAISQYLTWLYRNFVEDPVDHMKDRSIATIIHQDPFLIDMMLDDIAKIFKKALEWDKKDLNDLIKDVALFEYEFAHSMPHKRGSGAIAEWLERAIFGYHGFSVSYNQKKMVSFEVYISSLKEFVENYMTMIQLEKINNEKEQVDVKKEQVDVKKDIVDVKSKEDVKKDKIDVKKN